MLHEIYPVFQDDYSTCDSQKYNVSSQTQVLADTQDRESDKYMFLYLCTFFLIPPPKKIKDSYTILKTIEIIKPKNLWHENKRTRASIFLSQYFRKLQLKKASKVEHEI